MQIKTMWRDKRASISKRIRANYQMLDEEDPPLLSGGSRFQGQKWDGFLREVWKRRKATVADKAFARTIVSCCFLNV